MPTSARRRHRVGTGGPWGTGLLTLGIGSIAKGGSYLVPADPPGLDDAVALLTRGQILTPQFWGLVWIAAGLFAVVKALRPPQRHTDVWTVVAMASLWSMAYLMQWLLVLIDDGEATRIWTSAVAWGSLTAVVISLGKCVNPPTTTGRT